MIESLKISYCKRQRGGAISVVTLQRAFNRLATLIQQQLHFAKAEQLQLFLHIPDCLLERCESTLTSPTLQMLRQSTQSGEMLLFLSRIGRRGLRHECQRTMKDFGSMGCRSQVCLEGYEAAKGFSVGAERTVQFAKGRSVWKMTLQADIRGSVLGGGMDTADQRPVAGASAASRSQWHSAHH